MGDYGMCGIKCSNIVHIKMHDGMVKKMDCWFVLDLRKNRISLSTLAKDGVKYLGKRE